MKVLHFYKTYFPDSVCGGGVEQVINQIILSTSPLGVRSEVLTLMPKPCKSTVTIGGHVVHQCQSTFEIASTPFSMAAYAKFKELAKQADIIHYHFPWPFMDLLHLVCRIKKPSLVTYHSDIIKQKFFFELYKPLQNKFLASVNCIVATSPNYLATSSVLKKIVDKTRVIPLGLDKNYYPNPVNTVFSQWQEKLPAKFFLFIGVLRYYKGLHVLIEAAKKLDYPIVIVGSGPLEQELKSQAKALKLKNIYFLGRIDDENKNALLRLCYALVFPSNIRTEAFGITLLEAAMFGKPMISCEIGTGTTYINIDKETGVVVPPNDPAALGQAMQFLWNNPQEAVAMGCRAEQRYWSLFTAEKMGASYFALYQKLLTEPSIK